MLGTASLSGESIVCRGWEGGIYCVKPVTNSTRNFSLDEYLFFLSILHHVLLRYIRIILQVTFTVALGTGYPQVISPYVWHGDFSAIPFAVF